MFSTFFSSASWIQRRCRRSVASLLAAAFWCLQTRWRSTQDGTKFVARQTITTKPEKIVKFFKSEILPKSLFVQHFLIIMCPPLYVIKLSKKLPKMLQLINRRWINKKLYFNLCEDDSCLTLYLINHGQSPLPSWDFF